jgi:hypothetical protein
MTFTFDAAAHAYYLDEVRVPSVTGILQASGLADFSRIPPSIREDALERGRAVHAAIHYYNERDLDVESFCADFPLYAGYVRAWLTFCEQRHFVAVLNEHRIVSRRYKVAGTFDCLGLLDGQAVLLDFKTGRPQDVAANLQTAAYLSLAHEWAREDEQLAAFFTLHPIVTRHAIRLKKDGTFTVESYTAPTDFRQFRTLVEAQQIIASYKGSWIDLADVA